MILIFNARVREMMHGIFRIEKIKRLKNLLMRKKKCEGIFFK